MMVLTRFFWPQIYRGHSGSAQGHIVKWEGRWDYFLYIISGRSVVRILHFTAEAIWGIREKISFSLGRIDGRTDDGRSRHIG